jgi:hypothetical protein
MRGNLGDARTRETSYRPTTHILIPLDWKIFELEGGSDGFCERARNVPNRDDENSDAETKETQHSNQN